ncbi:MAG: YbaN family protein [Peptococcaceae bacterium]|nr:YbaN family protein [Peptococcaceae bacterium]
MTILRLLLIALGWLSLALGTLGIFLPVLPTVPLYLLAAFLFAKSSERLNRWFVGTELYKKNLENYLSGKGITFKSKCRIALTITFSMALSLYFVSDMTLVVICLAGIWLGLMIYFFGFVKTRRLD